MHRVRGFVFGKLPLLMAASVLLLLTACRDEPSLPGNPPPGPDGATLPDGLPAATDDGDSDDDA